MRMMLTGFAGWVRMGRDRSEAARVVDTALTVVATLGVAAGYALLRS